MNFFNYAFLKNFLKKKVIRRYKIFNPFFLESFFFFKKTVLFKKYRGFWKKKNLLLKSHIFFSKNDFHDLIEQPSFNLTVTDPSSFRLNSLNLLKDITNAKSSFSLGLLHKSYFFFFLKYRQKHYVRQLAMRNIFLLSIFRKLNLKKFEKIKVNKFIQKRKDFF